jgi:hypothetical protein
VLAGFLLPDDPDHEEDGRAEDQANHGLA